MTSLMTSFPPAVGRALVNMQLGDIAQTMMMMMLAAGRCIVQVYGSQWADDDQRESISTPVNSYCQQKPATAAAVG